MAGFTFVELLVLILLLGFFSALILPIQTKTRPGTQSLRCINNHRQLVLAWNMYADDNNGGVPFADSQGISVSGPTWFTGNLTYAGTFRGNWDTNLDMASSPLWPYTGKSPQIFRCPADKSTVSTNGLTFPRIRSISMSQVFGKGVWLDGKFSSSSQYWRTYDRRGIIVLPAKTWLFCDENPDSINDANMAVTCTGNQQGDPPTSSLIIDFPSNLHNRGAAISFTDGHCDIHKWIGNTIGAKLVSYSSNLVWNVSSGDSLVDMQWLAQNTTVRK
jgi:type II secretory pathway pseudopilin PulG